MGRSDLGIPWPIAAPCATRFCATTVRLLPSRHLLRGGAPRWRALLCACRGCLEQLLGFDRSPDFARPPDPRGHRLGEPHRDSPPPALRRVRPRAPVLRPPPRRAPRRLPRQAPRLRTRRPRERSLTRRPRSRLSCPTAPPGHYVVSDRTPNRAKAWKYDFHFSLEDLATTSWNKGPRPPSAWARVTSTPAFRFVTAACTTTSTPTPRLTSPAIRQAAT